MAEDSIILLYDERLGPVINLLTITLDLVLRLEVFRDKPRWKD